MEDLSQIHLNKTELSALRQLLGGPADRSSIDAAVFTRLHRAKLIRDIWKSDGPDQICITDLGMAVYFWKRNEKRRVIWDLVKFLVPTALAFIALLK